MLQNILNLLKDGKFVRQNGNRTLLLTNEISVQTVTLNCLNIIKLINKLLNTIVVKRIRTKRLELLRNYFHSCLRRDCLPISTCSLFITLLYIFFVCLQICVHLILSKQILLTKYSSPELIMNYLNNQLDIYILLRWV